LQAIAALWSKKIAKYGGKWDFWGQTAILLTSYFIFNKANFAVECGRFGEKFNAVKN
jgi:hypothetical protein